MTRFSVAFVLVAGLATTINSPIVAQQEKTDIYALILALSDIEEATKLMTIYDPNEDGVVDKFEQERLSWKDEVHEFDMNRDGKLTHLEIVVRQAKLRDDEGITQFDINNVNTFLRRYDRNQSKHIEEPELFEKPEPGYLPKSMFESADLNKDGKVGLDELSRYFAKQKSSD